MPRVPVSQASGLGMGGGGGGEGRALRGEMEESRREALKYVKQSPAQRRDLRITLQMSTCPFRNVTTPFSPIQSHSIPLKQTQDRLTNYSR